ncbi:MAG: DUF433 domain-containing protein [Bacteroidales bacterium]|nr:DUF433 domain-containing protein [Bacteroidales bacterium]
MNPLLERISVNPKICFGKPCIKGHRIWVSLILDFLAAGHDIEYILENYPQLKREDVLACLAYEDLLGQARHLDASVEPMTEEEAEDFVRGMENEFNQIEGRW